MATQPRSFWDRLPGSQAIRAGWNAAAQWLEEERIFGKSVLWFVSGWRLGLIALVVAIIFPQEFDDSFVLAGINVGVYVLLALGLNIVVGYAGLLDLGYVAFFIIGSYTYAAFSTGFLDNANKMLVATPILSFWVLLPLGALLAGIFGVLLGAPTLRLRGDYLAIVTLGFGEIARIFVLNVPFFGGANGLNPNPAPKVNTPLGSVNFGNFIDHSAFYYLVLTCVVLVVIVVTLLRNSSVGRAWIAIREDETAAAASGVNLVRTKLLAFATGATIGGLGGVLSTAAVPSITPDGFNFNVSITILVMIVLGGIGSIPGVIIGAIILQYFSVQLSGQLNDFIHNSPLVSNLSSPLHGLATHDFNQDKFLLYGVLLLAMVLLRPQGIIPDRRRQRELRQASAVEEVSAVGIVALEQAGASVNGLGAEDATEYTGPGSDAQGRGE
jgi:ABC-type branched-subunit amino acid transport system permease subunit